MDYRTIVDAIPLWGFFALTLVLVLLAIEAGSLDRGRAVRAVAQ